MAEISAYRAIRVKAVCLLPTGNEHTLLVDDEETIVLTEKHR